MAMASNDRALTIPLDILQSILEDVYREGFQGSMEAMESIVNKALETAKYADSPPKPKPNTSAGTIFDQPGGLRNSFPGYYARTYNDTPF